MVDQSKLQLCLPVLHLFPIASVSYLSGCPFATNAAQAREMVGETANASAFVCLDLFQPSQPTTMKLQLVAPKRLGNEK